ncbi:UNVERIFIED_CONTAM: hypothetical protein PYX00_002647 [Menopon gallinae]|uniref:Uncharacterized protein n=1 Tax=Menopon gallinae TaxID=328185 RepID=A0AAW2HXL7_9NEOP
MIAQLFCLTAGSGLPLLARKKGETEMLPFSHVASLNGVHLFAKSHQVTLRTTVTQDATLYWKDYFDSVTLIAVASAVSSQIVEKFLDSVFNGMVLCLGIEEMTNIRNPERLKRELRITHKLLDKLFECLECGERGGVPGKGPAQKSTAGDIIEFVETILCQENHALQGCLENFVEAVESLYGCVTVHGKLAVATRSWWELDNEEKKLLNALISVLNANSTSSDVPVFLPRKSPSVPFRLVTLRVINGIEISTLCGPSPSLSEIEQSVLHVWRSAIELLRSAEKTYPRNFPVAVSLDPNVLGFLLVNLTDGKFLISRNQSKKESCSLSGSHRLNILRTFYYRSASVFLMNDGNADPESERLASESYWCSEYHKCHALRNGPNLICVLYAASVPTHTMR